MRNLIASFLIAAVTFPILRAAEPSRTLPLMVIETENHQTIVSKDNYIRATYYIDPCGVEGVQAIGTVDSPLPMQIKGRGNFTWTFNKKPYRIKLDKKAALLGMESSKHFALIAHADDKRAFMRNLTGFEVSRMAGMPWTPADQPCEVILNGDYIGLYFLTETIRFDKQRINLVNPDDAVDDWLMLNPDKTADQYPFTADDYTGAWLVEFDNTDDANQIKVATRQVADAQIRVTYKTPEDYVTDEHRRWLAGEIDAIDALIYADDNADGAWFERIDLTDAAKFFVVNQIMNNYECYSGSCYLYKDKGDAAKWHFGPVWDFGSSFQPTRDVTKWIWDSQYIQHWIRNMWNCQAFLDEVKRIFVEMDNEGFDRLFNYQNDYAQRIAEAARHDAERWQADGYGNADMQTPLAEVQEQLRNAIDSFGYKLGVEGYEEPKPVINCPIYLRGSDIGGWAALDEYKFYKVADDIYDLKVANLSGLFKIADSTWNLVDYGGTEGEQITMNVAYPLVERGANMSLACGSAANVTVRFDVANTKVTVFDEAGAELLLVGNGECEYYNLQGIKVAHPRRGEVYIVKTPNKVYKTIYR